MKRLLEESKKVWEKIWKKQDIQIDSKEDDAQIAVRFALLSSSDHGTQGR